MFVSSSVRFKLEDKPMKKNETVKLLSVISLVVLVVLGFVGVAYGFGDWHEYCALEVNNCDWGVYYNCVLSNCCREIDGCTPTETGGCFCNPGTPKSNMDACMGDMCGQYQTYCGPGCGGGC